MLPPPYPETYIDDDIFLCVSAGSVECGEKRLQMLGAVVLRVEQQHREQLGGPDPRGHQPVRDIVGDGRHKPAKISHYQLSAAQPWTLHWQRKTTHGNNGYSCQPMETKN